MAATAASSSGTKFSSDDDDDVEAAEDEDDDDESDTGTPKSFLGGLDCGVTKVAAAVSTEVSTMGRGGILVQEPCPGPPAAATNKCSRGYRRVSSKLPLLLLR
jgi:hypothetical protein